MTTAVPPPARPAPTVPEITWGAGFDIEAFASRNDGTHAGDMLRLTVTLEAAPDVPIDTTADLVRAWLARYFADQDLTRVLDFAPTAGNLAVWVARVARQFGGDVFTAVGVTVRIGGRPETRTATVKLAP